MIPRPGVRLLFATVEDFAGALTEAMTLASQPSKSQTLHYLVREATGINKELSRLNDNLESLMVFGLNVRSHDVKCVSPSEFHDAIDNDEDRTACELFLREAITSGALKLKGGAK